MLKNNSYLNNGYAGRQLDNQLITSVGQSQRLAARGFTGQRDSIPTGYRGLGAYAPAIKPGGLKGFFTSNTSTASSSIVLNGFGDIVFTLPLLTMESVIEVRSGNINFQLPLLSLGFTVKTGTIGSLLLDLPLVGLSMYSGGALSFTLSSLSLSSHVSIGEVGRLSFKLPNLGLSATGYQDIFGHLSFALPCLSLSSHTTVHGIGNLLFDISGLKFNLHSLTGQVGRLAIALPVVRLSAAGYTVVQGGVSFVLPNLRTEFHGQIPVTAIYRGFVLNTRNFAVTEYGEFEFDSLVFFNGQYLGSNQNGIYVLGGNKDMNQDIEAGIKTGPTDFNKDIVKRPKDIWISHRSDGALTVSIETDEDIKYDYPLAGNHRNLEDDRVKVGRGIKGRFQSIGVSNVGGSDFDIDRISVLVDPIQHRKR